MINFERFREKLAYALDDNLKTRQWYNCLDYIIIGLIVISTVAIFLSTFNSIVEKYGYWLYIIDLFTTIFFTVEIILRLVCIDLIDERYKGVKGRLKYCCSFYGLIDILATFPFYLHYFLPVPYSMLKVLRIIRVLRIFRFMKSFRLLAAALSSKSRELFVSLQFLVVITFILSIVLYFLEHEAQPDVYENGFYSVIWAFAQYIGDPGGFADNPPITFWGRVVACIVGVLGIAIFAVPAGVIGAGFTEAIEEEENKLLRREYAKKVYNSFQRQLDRCTRNYIVPKFQSIVDIQVRMGMKVDEILDGINESDNLRLINLASTKPIEEKADDKLAVEVFLRNRSYGCCINRKSKVTIVSPASLADPVSGHFAFYVAKFGGFNFLSREVGELRPYKSYYIFKDENDVDGLSEYLEDLRCLAPDEDSWVITLLVASGANEPVYPTQIHFGYGGKIGDESFKTTDILFNNVELGKKLIDNISTEMKSNYGFESDCQRYHDTSSPNLFVRHLKKRPNTLVLRYEWSIGIWNSESYAVAMKIADSINSVLEPEVEKEFPTDLKVKACAYEDYLG